MEEKKHRRKKRNLDSLHLGYADTRGDVEHGHDIHDKAPFFVSKKRKQNHKYGGRNEETARAWIDDTGINGERK